MKLSDILQYLHQNSSNIFYIFLFSLTFVQVAPIQINPWSWIARKFGKAINQDIIDEIGDIKKDVEQIQVDRAKDREASDKYKTSQRRNRILVFADELRIHRDHSEELFNQILEDVDDYEKYCLAHPDYKNSKATDSIMLIREVYHKCKADDKFI